MFKSWQIFFFSLIPLALVFAGVIIGSVHGVDSQQEIFPTQAPTAESEEPPPEAPPGTTQLEIASPNQTAFDKSSLEAAAGQPVQLIFDNPETGILHNVSIYTDRSASQAIFTGELITGPASITYEFDAPQPGTYFFRCDAHTDMTGTFTTN